MRSLPFVVLCLAILPACKTDPNDPAQNQPHDPVAEDQFARTAAETLCAQLFACECGDSPLTTQTEPLPWASEAECVAEKQPEYQALLDGVLMGGGEYSPDCGGRLIADLEIPDCQSRWAYLQAGGRFYDGEACPLVQNDRAVGAECDPYVAFINDCGEGKWCSYDFICIEVGEVPVQLGGACEIEGAELPCEPGLYCVNDGAGNDTCRAPAKLGDPCPNYYCWGGENLNCDPATLTCIANPGEGESCESSGVCGDGLYCDGGQEFTCVPQYEYGSGCSTDSVCANGGLCIGNVCTEPPAAVCSGL